jgi:hypothetical protein
LGPTESSPAVTTDAASARSIQAILVTLPYDRAELDWLASQVAPARFIHCDELSEASRRP